ncbi:MAG: ABC transporter permease [Pseudomonadota bacterium]|nr:ABC transporter permease [Pseudomonadota bacterium]
MSSENDLNDVAVIRPPKSWELLDFRELLAYRDLFYFLVWRDIKVLYAQTVLGFAWAILNPLIQIIIFSVIFGKVARLDTGGIPYVLFSTVAIIPWTYMSEAMSASSQSLVTGQNMLGKVYFPRLIFPLTPVLAKLVDFSISLLLLVGVMIYYKITPSINLVYLPVFVLLMMAIPAGVGLWMSSLAIRFRDVKFAMPFVMRMLIYTAPILYSAEKIPEQYRLLYSLNPIVGVIEGYRACLLGTEMQWEYILPGVVTGVLLLVSGAMYFRRMERVFVDVI